MTDTGYTVERLAFSTPFHVQGHSTTTALSHDRPAKGPKGNIMRRSGRHHSTSTYTHVD